MSNKRESTKKAIINAFTILTYEKEDIRSISVKDIIERAQISRSTFYAYFDNVEDVTAEMARIYGQEFGEEMTKISPVTSEIRGYRCVYYRLLHYVKEHQKIAQAILLNYSNSEVTEAISEPILKTMYTMLRQTHMDVDERTLRYAATYWGYGIYGFMKKWLKNDCKPDVEEMSKIMDDAISDTANFILGANIIGSGRPDLKLRRG